jgi:hypothetical protein
MKITEIQGYRNYISKFDLANMFNIYDDPKLGANYKTYNLNRTIIITGLENIPASELSTYKVNDGDNLQMISYKLYGTIELWWIIAKINNIRDAAITLTSGTSIYTLNTSIVNNILNKLRL